VPTCYLLLFCRPLSREGEAVNLTLRRYGRRPDLGYDFNAQRADFTAFSSLGCWGGEMF